MEPRRFKLGQKCKSNGKLPVLVMVKDEFGDCMFVIIKGDCGIYLTAHDEGSPDAVVGEKQVLGEKALQDA